MEKGISKRILCDTCRTTITHTDYITVRGKKRTLHYCDKDKCITDEQRLQAQVQEQDLITKYKQDI